MVETRAWSDAPSDDPTKVGDVPDVFVGWYRAVLDFAHGTPPIVQDFALVFTEVGVLLLGGLMLLNLWRTRELDSRARAFALLVPPATVIAYAVSEATKGIISAQRPCHTLIEVVPLTACPPPDDWSFPSNHATIAGAAAIALVISWRRWPGTLVVLLGALTAFSRVFIGVHYPHDVIAGFLLGATMATTVLLVLGRPVTALVERLRAHRTTGAPPIVEPRAARDSMPTTPIPRLASPGRPDDDQQPRFGQQPIARQHRRRDEDAATQRILQPPWTRR